MKLDLSEILSHVGMRYAYTMDEPPIVDEDLECSAPIRGSIVFSNTGNVLLINGSADTKVVVPCSRCLVYYEEPIHLAIEEQFAVEAKFVGPRGRQGQVVIEEDENPDAGRLFEGPLFDLTELLRQGLMLALPIQLLHDPDCRGLCQTCGQNLNEGACHCSNATINPALEALRALLQESPDSEEESR